MADNQESLPSLLFPIITSSWCIPANFTDAQRFQKWQNDWGTQIIINIPGLANLSPAALQQIQDTLVSLQNQITANDIEFQKGTIPISVLNGVTTVSLPRVMPNNSYFIGLSLIDDGNVISTNPPTVSEVPNSKTTTQFQFRSHGAPIAWSVNWAVFGTL